MVARIVLLLILFCSFTLNMIAGKIGYVDSSKIRKELKEFQEALNVFKQEQSEWETKTRERKKEIEDMEQELEKQKLLLNPEQYKKRDEMIQKKKIEYQTYLNSIWGENGKALQREKELTKPIMKKIQEAIKEVANDDGYDMVFDVYEGNVVFAIEKIDLTEDVIEKLNETVE